MAAEGADPDGPVVFDPVVAQVGDLVDVDQHLG
jgi:hypothetical protein